MHQWPVRSRPGVSSRVGQQHEGEQADRFGLVGHQIGMKATQSDGLGTQAAGPPPKGTTRAFTVARVRVEETLALRQAVLRPYQSLEEVALPGDDDPSTVAFAAIDPEGELLSVARVTLEAPPFPTVDLIAGGAPEWRLRGMATRPEARNLGIGTAVLRAAIAHVGTHGGGLLWCNARVPAIGLYRRAGFTSHGEEWLDPDIGPHIVMWRLV